MLSFIFMIGFSLYLTLYGYAALFKQEWLIKVRALSARLEGKGDIKHEDLSSNVGQARKIMAILALILGIIGLVMSVMTMFIFIQAQNGPISV